MTQKTSPIPVGKDQTWRGGVYQSPRGGSLASPPLEGQTQAQLHTFQGVLKWSIYGSTSFDGYWSHGCDSYCSHGYWFHGFDGYWSHGCDDSVDQVKPWEDHPKGGAGIGSIEKEDQIPPWPNCHRRYAHTHSHSYTQQSNKYYLSFIYIYIYACVHMYI